MKKTLSFLHHDIQETGPQYLEDLATAYWFSEVLFTSVEMEIFSLIEEKGASVDTRSRTLKVHPQGLKRFLQALSAMGLVTKQDKTYFNTQVASDYLVRGREHYQGDSILWRKFLHLSWKGISECLKKGRKADYAGHDSSWKRMNRIRKYISAMDSIAKIKSKEILGFFEGQPLKGEILDVGAGSGAIAAAFLEHFPLTKAVLLDLPDILDYTREILVDKSLDGRMRYCPGNVLEPWPVRKGTFDLVILSNIVHAYSEKELPHILMSASDCLRKKGIVVIHDFFLEHSPEKAALSDLNMFLNTFNGRIFSGKLVQDELCRLGLSCTDLIALKTDTAVLFASKDKRALGALHIEAVDLLSSRILAIGFRKVYRITTEDIHISDWTDLRCRFGCDRYGSPRCPPNSPTSQKTRDIVRDYKYALLLEGEPPTKVFQQRVLQAERETFKAGFYKAFSYWAGPCSLCKSCATNGVCTNTANARPSMEGAGIDVFETVRRAGATVRTLKNKDSFIKYFALILLG
ncbi:MAG TPA: metal-binding protein [Nitrospiraceae bacterium]|nr:metal-binding protein [Nitrospiraceae bacterium]